MESVSHWFGQIQQVCQRAQLDYIDIIVDQCGVNFSVIPALSGFTPPVKWQSLYEGLPEDIHREDAPLLVRIELKEVQQRQWLYSLAPEMTKNAPLLVLGSFWPFEKLAAWLSQCADALHEGRPGIFRFWDTRLAPYLFSHILNGEQQNQLIRPALFWCWQDSDGQTVLLEGNGAFFDKTECCQPITISDDQFEKLMCLCDTKVFLSSDNFPYERFASKEAAFAACLEGMLAATEAGVILDYKRDEWVLEWLKAHAAPVVVKQHHPESAMS